MKTYTPANKDRVYLYTDNRGTQPKYRSMGYWYKVNALGAEGYAEELCSVILDHATLPPDVTYVSYERCKIGNNRGCRSANFLGDGDQFISIDILYRNLTGENIVTEIGRIPTIQARFDYLIDFAERATGIDLTNYIKATVTLDALTLNPDRHFGNLGVILHADGTFSPAPIFDNGQALGANYTITPPSLKAGQLPEKLSAATFSGSFFDVVDQLGPGFTLDYNGLQEDLARRYTQDRMIRVLENQLRQYQSLLEEKEEMIEFQYA